MARPMKPLVRGGGYYPSNGWTPLVYAGGYTTANGGEEPAPPPIEKTVTSNPIHILDALAKPAQALSVKLEPIQDLHGYGNPWPAGGGANKCSSDFEIGNIDWHSGNNVGSTNRIRTVDYIEVAAGETYYFCIKSNGDNIPVDLHFYDANKVWLGSPVYINTTQRTQTIPQDCKYIRFAVYPAYGTTYKNDIAVNYPATVTSFVPYSNICPISGHTDADVTRTGVNVWDEEWEKGTISTTTGENVPGSSGIRTKNYISVIPGESYFIYVGAAGDDNIKARWYDENKNFIGTSPMVHYNSVFTVRNNAHFLRFCPQDSYGATYNHDISINYPSADHDYHAYSGTTYPIPLGQTVYGGTLDVTTGKLTVDRAMVDLGSLNWTKSNTSGGKWWFSTNKSDAKRPASNNDYANVLCSQYEKRTPNQLWGGNVGVGINYSSSHIVVVDSNYSDATAFKTAMDGVQLVYELATPTTIQLTPTQVELLQGENNLFSDGEMTLTYLADGNASDEEALNILLGGRYTNTHGEDEPTDREALDIVLGGKK